MKIGYARVSTKEQNLDRQLDALKEAGCEKIFSEQISGATKERPELIMLLAQIRDGDQLVVDKLSRLGRSLKDLIQIVADLEKQNVTFISLKDSIDTSTATGRLVFHIFASLAEFERDLISERTHAGLASAKARGRQGGRPKGLTEKAKKTAALAETLYKSGDYSVREICEQLGISKPTVYNYLRARSVSIS